MEARVGVERPRRKASLRLVLKGISGDGESVLRSRALQTDR